MALVQNTITGRTSGSVGGITFTTWKGLNVMKSKPENKYSNPSTTQLQNNSKFAIMVAMYRAVSIIVTAGFKALAVKKSEYNAFMQENPYSTVVTGSPGSYIPDTQSLIISKGPESQAAITPVTKTANGANTITVAWNANNEVVPENSKVYIALFNRSTGEFITSGDFNAIGATSDDFTFTGIGTNIATTDVKVFWVNSLTGKACDSINAV